MKFNKKDALFIAMLTVFTTVVTANTVVTKKIVNNGPDNTKRVFAVVAEGYSELELPQFEADVDRMVVNGVLGNDLFNEYRSAFNIYRVNLISNQSGVSTPTQPRDTALQMLFTGEHRLCWMEETITSDMLLRRALDSVPKYDYALIILNEARFGGCQRGNRLYVTRGVQWDVVAHEYGHGIGQLFDEYWTANGSHPASMPINERNCSTALDRNNVVWRGLLDNGAIFPPTSDSSSPFPAVGMFRGCRLKSDGIYRPSNDCRMRSNTPEFCPVCRLHLKKTLDPFVGDAASAGGGGQTLNKYLSLLIELKQSGQTKILSATEIETPVELRRETFGNYVLELTKIDHTSELVLLPEDPFEMRSFADPNDNRGESVLKTDRTTLIVNLPAVGLETIDQEKLGLKIHGLRSYFRLDPNLPQAQQVEALKTVKSSPKQAITITTKQLSTELKMLPKKVIL